MKRILTALSFLVLASFAIFLTIPTASAATCGANGQRPCKVWERVPSCNKGLREDFAKNKCVRPVRPGVDCGRENQRPCTVVERVPSCNNGLVEDFSKGRCVKPAPAGVRPGVDCGRENQRPCTVIERVPSCNDGLVEDFARGICIVPAVAGVDCGNAGQRPCKVWERVPSCNENLKEDFARGICVALRCGEENERPCTVVERIPSCDAGLVEDFLQNRCVMSENARRQEIATRTMAEFADVIISQMATATGIANNPQVASALGADNDRGVAQAAGREIPPGAIILPDGGDLRTMTIGAAAGAKVIIGGSGGAGTAIDLTGRLPVHAYATADYGVSLGISAASGMDVGFWTCQVNKIGGDSWGVEFGPQDIIGAAKVLKGVKGASLANMAKAGPDMGVSLWFDYDNVFQGFVLTPGVSAGVDFGGVVRATTTVKDDPGVDCKGNSGVGGVAIAEREVFAPPRNPEGGNFAGDITYSGLWGKAGRIRQFSEPLARPRPTATRICLLNRTQRPKSLSHDVEGVRQLSAAPDSQSCMYFRSDRYIHFTVFDDNFAVSSNVMNLADYENQTLWLEWVED